MNIEIDQNKLIEVAVNRLLEDQGIEDRVTELVRTRLDEEINKRLTEIFDASIQASIQEAVESKIALGWADFDRFGNRGPVKTLRQRVAERLELKSYSHGVEVSFADQVIKSRLEEFLRIELSEEAKEIRAKFAKTVDAVLQAKLVEMIRASVFGS